MMFLTFALMLTMPSREAPENVRDLSPAQKIERTKAEIEELKISIASLDAVYVRISEENKENEKSFQKTLKALLVPLLHWPGEAAVTNLPSWIEREHSAFILQKFQKTLIRQPLQIISDRELRLSQIKSLREEMEASIITLQRKNELLTLQKEEYDLLKKKLKEKGKKVKREPKPTAL